MLRYGWLIVGALLTPVCGLGQDSPPNLASVTEAMQGFVESGDIAGAVTVVVDDQSILHQSAVGRADLDADAPMQPDTLFWIASMTKPITGTAVMMLVEEGKLALQDPIDKHLPAMADLRTRQGEPVEITVQHLLSHTSGMDELGGESYSLPTLEAAAKQYAEVDVLFAPGSEWRYSQTSINTAARIVEVVSGQSFDEFVQQRIFEPLGMNDTTFYLSAEQAQRLAAAYRKHDGRLEEVPIRILNGQSPTSRERFPAANGGLFSTGPDYARFCQMLLGDGQRADVRILQPESVQTMRTIVTGELEVGFTPGNGWGVGVCIVREPQGVSEVLSPGSFGHGGAYGTQAWIDPVKNRAYVLMIQRSDLPNADASPIRHRFQNAAHASLSGNGSRQ